MTDRHIYHQGDDIFALASMKKYLDRKQEMDKLLDTLIAPVIVDKNLHILDAGCGLGHNLFFLNQLSPGSTFVGVDQTPVYIAEAKKLFSDLQNISFEVANVEDLPEKYNKNFEVSISRAVISWIPYYEEFMRALVGVTKKHIFISSLFYEGDVDFITKVKMYRGESGVSDKLAEEYRNVYSLPRFKNFMISLGAQNIEVADFEIGIDLPKQPVDQMSTYTVTLDNGKRLQLSGAILMNWKWIKIDL